MMSSENRGAKSLPLLKQFRLFSYPERVIATVDITLNLISVGFIMVLMLFAAAEIVGRYLFNYPIPGHVEIVELIMAAIVFLGISYTQRVGGHIRMDLFITKALRGRSYHIAEAITLTLSLFAFSIITVASFRFALDAYHVGDTTTYILWPTWPSKLCIPLGSFMLCLRFILQLIQHIVQALIGVEIRDLE